MDRKAIGIDLGMVYSSVAVFQHGKIEVIPNKQSNRKTPSYFAFTNNERLIGDAAKNQAALNPTNTIFDAQRLLGHKFDDPTVQFQVEYKRKIKCFTPEEIISMILTRMKDIAEAYLAIKDACVFVGLNGLYIISGSTAAGLGYGFDKKFPIARNIFVFDLGGGHFNVSILAIEEGVFEVKSKRSVTNIV
ncbi:unnamed protein product, partial [Rotaria sp. Silwood1]